MVIECRDYLIQKLKESGIKTNIHTAMKTLKNSSESHVGAVLFQDESLKRLDEKTIIIKGGKRKRATKLMQREIRFNVIIGEYQPEKAETIYEAFLQKLGKQLETQNGTIDIEPVRCDWVSAEDSILQAKIAANLEVVMTGTMIKESQMLKIKEIEIEKIEKEQTWQE